MLKPLALDVDAIPSLPVSVSDMKNHLRVDLIDDDTLIETYIYAATAMVENETHRSIVSREHRWTLADFPQTTYQKIRLPRGKTQSVTSIAYTSGGAVTTLTGPTSGSPAGTDYQESLSGEEGGWLMPNQGESWPSVDLDVLEPVVITFTAGWTTIPQDINHAIKLIVGHWYENRETVIVGTSSAEMPMAATALLGLYSLTRWYA